MLKKSEKEKIINQLAESMAKATILIATDYRGMNAKDMLLLRRQLREAGVEYKVTKNTLTRFAADKTGHSEIDKILTGPLAIAIGYDDVVRPAKIINDFIKTSGANLQIKGGLLGTKFIDKDAIISLANMPPREVLLAKLLSQLTSPIQMLHSVLSAPLRNLTYALNARIEQLQKS